MKIYIDFDDVICETAKYFTKIAKELFNIDVPYREVQFFNLQKSFDLSGEQYDELMKAGHIPENLLDYEETPGASEVINKWVDEGHEVFVVTGRPFDSYEPSRRWLDEHHLNRLPIYFVDKYGREMFKQDHTYNLTLEELYCMHFDFAIEDSPAAFEHVQHFKDCKVAVYDRPWNKQVEFPDESFVRCLDWKIDYGNSRLLFRLQIYRYDKDDGGDRCFGILADMDFIIICTYEKDGENPELLIYKKR